MANGQVNNNLLDEALMPNQYLGNNMEEYILSGGDPFMAPDVTKMHFYTDEKGFPQSTQYINEIPGFQSPLTQMGTSIMSLAREGGSSLASAYDKAMEGSATLADYIPGTGILAPGIRATQKVNKFVRSTDWTEPHNALPALGMGADYVFPGLGAPFDLIDGALYQYQGQPGMAGLAYSSMFLPIALAGGKRTLSTGVDMATGIPGSGTYLGAQLKGSYYGTSDLLSNTLRSSKSLVNDMTTTGKVDDLNLAGASKLEDVTSGASSASRSIDEIDNVIRQTGELDPYFIGNPNITRFDMENLPIHLDEAYNRAFQHTIDYKTGAEAFERFKLNYPNLAEQFKNVDEFDTFIKSSLDDITASGNVQYFDADKLRHKPGGDFVVGGMHHGGTGAMWTDDAMKQAYYPGGLPEHLAGSSPYIDVAAGAGRSIDEITSTTAHEIHHGLTRKIWEAEFKLSPDYQKFLKSPAYLAEVDKVKHMPEEFAGPHLDRIQQKFIQNNAGNMASPGRQSLNRLVDETYRAPHLSSHIPVTGYPKGTGDILQKEIQLGGAMDDFYGAFGTKRVSSDVIEEIEQKWLKDYPYLTTPDEVGARVTEIRLMDDVAKRNSMNTYGHPYGRQGQQIIDYHPDFFRSGLFNKMYGAAPIGVGMGLGRRSLLDYTSDKQSE